MQVGLGCLETRLQTYSYKDRWRAPRRRAFFAKPEIFSRLCNLPATPDAQAIFECAAIFDDWIIDWRENNGEFAKHHDYSKSDLDEHLTLDTTLAECPGLPWIVDLWERLGGSLHYTQGPMARPRAPRFHCEPTPTEISKLARKLNLAPHTDVERAILACQFERLSLPLRTRIAPILSV